MGSTIDSLGTKFSSMQESERPSKVLVITITDGLENASKKYPAEKLRNMIETQSNVYNWDFIYTGANQDAILVGNEMGVATAYAATFNPTAASYRKMSGSILENSKNYRCAESRSVAMAALNFTEEDRSEMIS